MDISTFATLHGLDKEAVELLEACSTEILEEVFANFHSENSNNPSARLSSFVKKMVGGKSGGMSSRLLTRLEAFVSQWSLDAAAQENLSSASPEVQDHVISKFSPDGATKNINAALMSFVKLARIKVEEEYAQTALRRSNFAVGAAVPRRISEPYLPNHEVDSIDTVAVANFIRKHDLDSKASAMLIELPGNVRESVLTSFKPSEGADTSKLFTSFALSRWKGKKAPERRRERMPSPILSRKRGRPDIQDFIEKFGLDESSVSTLESLPKDVARSVMADFRPPLDTENVNKLFVSFARSQGRAGDRPVGQERRSKTSVWADEQGLDDKARDLLYSLSSDTQASVMRVFQPEAGGNVNKIFTSFVNNMSRRRS